MEHELTILSPEKTILTYPLAGIGRRISAQLIDAAVIFGIIILGAWASQLLAFLDTPLAMGFMLVLAAATPFLYFILLEGLWNGYTVGKLSCGLRVRMADGTPIRFSAAVARNLLRPADFLPMLYFAGILAIFTTPKSQRIGDLAAGTVVTREGKAVPTFTPAPHKAGIHPFEEHIPDMRKMTNEEYVALKRFCDRFPELPPHIQERLVNEIWEPVALRHGVEPIPNVHPLYLAEAVVMKYGRQHGLL